MAPWADMKKAYLSGGKTLRQLANEWQVPFSDVSQRSRQEGWSAQRRREEQFEQQVAQMDAGQREALRRRLAELDELEREAAEAAEAVEDLNSDHDDDHQAF